MLLHPLKSAGLLMRSRTEWLKGLGAEVTGSLGKEEASAGSRQNTPLGRGHGKEAAMYGWNLKQEVFLGLGRHKTPNGLSRASWQCRGVPVSLQVTRGRAALLTGLIWHPFSHSSEMIKTLLRLCSEPTPCLIQLLGINTWREVSYWPIFGAKLQGNYESMHTAGTRERSSQWTNLEIQLEPSIPFHPSKQSLC